MIDIKPITLLSYENISNEEVELYKEDKQYFFRVDFNYEEGDAIYKGHIEKIPVNFRLLGIYLGHDDYLTTRKICKVNLGLQEKMDVMLDENDAFLTLTPVKAKKAKIHEMTIEEIEKKLGYKVSIVNKKSE